MISCPNCSTALTPTDNSMLLQCEQCGIFIPQSAPIQQPPQSGDEFQPASSTPEPSPIATPTKPKEPVALPKRFRLNQFSRRLEISWGWFGKWSWFWLFFTLFWDGIVSVFLFGPANELGFIWIFMLPFIAIGLVLLYATLCSFLNRSTLRVTRGVLQVTHGPLPYPGREFPAGEIDQLYCQRYESGTVNDSPVYSYQVMVLLNDGRKEQLVRELDTLDEALYLEQEVERNLNIEDRPVEGETTG